MDINISSIHQLQRRESGSMVKYLMGTSGNRLFYADDSAEALTIIKYYNKHMFDSVVDHFSWITLANKALCYPNGIDPIWTDGTNVYGVGVIKPNAPVSVVENAIGSMASGNYYVGYSYQRSGNFAYETNVSEGTLIEITEEPNTIDTAFTYSGTTYTDITASLNSVDTNAELFSISGDYLYIGDALKFKMLNVLLTINASEGGISPTFEYSKGGSVWKEFTPDDGTGGFTYNGQITWVVDDLEDWAIETVNSITTKYWIRIKRTQSSITTAPTESIIEVTNSNKSIDMPVVASTDEQIDKIRIFCSTLGGTILYWVKDVDNVTATINMDSPNVSGYEAPTSYIVSPQAKFSIVKADRNVIAFTNDDEIGSAIIRWSEPRQPETFLTSSFYVYDAEDGDEITGIGSLLNYIVVFKKNKMLLIDSQSFGGNVGAIEISNKYGCIAPDSIQTVLGGKALIYLSDEGLMIFDGTQNVSLSDSKIDSRFEDMDTSKLADVKSAYYPTLQRYTIFIDIVGGTTKWINYYFKSGGFTDFVLLTPKCFAIVKDGDDRTKLLVGTSTTIEEIDYGTDDNSANIAWSFKTVEHSYGLESADKVTRRLYLDWYCETVLAGTLVLEPEYGTRTSMTKSPSHAGTGRLIDRVDLSGTGKVFSYELSGTGKQDMKVYGMNILFYPLSYEGVVD